MNAETSKPNQIIHNVATLDLRTTAEATIATIKRVENVAMVLYSPETAYSLTRFTLANVATTMEAPAHAAVLSGQTTLGKTSLLPHGTPLSWIVSGQLFVDAALSPEEFDQGVESLVISGQVICPEHLAGVMRTKIKQLSGQLLVYPDNAKLVQGKITLTESYLRQLPDHTTLIILGKLVATQTLPPELLTQKVAQLQIFGKAICSEENSEHLQNLQTQAGGSDLLIIPSGFELVERALVLDAGLLETFAGRKLYCTNTVQFDQDVTPEILEQAIDKLVATALLLAPVHLRKPLAQRCDLLNTQAIFYQGKLWLVAGESKIDQRWFDALEGEATLVVTGELEIDSTVEPSVLAARLNRVHNFGEISATSAQLAALQARVGLNEGEWNTPSDQPDINPNENVIGNIAYLKL